MSQEYELLLRENRELREQLRDVEAQHACAECAKDEYRAACNAVAKERDNAVHELAIAEDELRTLRAHRCGLPSSIIEALNSGDGTYRP
jgi:cell division septum initiation protein DivIVA